MHNFLFYLYAFRPKKRSSSGDLLKMAELQGAVLYLQASHALFGLGPCFAGGLHCGCHSYIHVTILSIPTELFCC